MQITCTLHLLVGVESDHMISFKGQKFSRLIFGYKILAIGSGMKD